MTSGPPITVLPELEEGDEIRMYFDRYRMEYDSKPESPLETTVLDVTTEPLPQPNPNGEGTVTKYALEVAEDDEKADEYWIEYTETPDGYETENVSYLLYRERRFGVKETTGGVANVDEIELVED